LVIDPELEELCKDDVVDIAIENTTKSNGKFTFLLLYTQKA
jgi:hypothetical protein